METLTLRQGITKGFFYTETIATTENGETVQIPPMGYNGTAITVTLVAGGSTGKVQVSTSSDAIIAAGSAIIWQDWPKGVQTGTISDVLVGPVTGIRGVSSSGEVTIEIII